MDELQTEKASKNNSSAFLPSVLSNPYLWINGFFKDFKSHIRPTTGYRRRSGISLLDDWPLQMIIYPTGDVITVSTRRKLFSNRRVSVSVASKVCSLPWSRQVITHSSRFGMLIYSRCDIYMAPFKSTMPILACFCICFLWESSAMHA